MKVFDEDINPFLLRIEPLLGHDHVHRHRIEYHVSHDLDEDGAVPDPLVVVAEPFRLLLQHVHHPTQHLAL